MAKARTTGRRLAGASVSASAAGIGGGLGLSYAAYSTDKDILQALLTFLEDRRVLFNPEDLEVEDQVAASVQKIRQELTEAMQQLDPDREAMASLSRLRAACRRYLDHPRVHMHHFDAIQRDYRRHGNAPGFFIALGELRATFGAELKQLAKLYDLRIEIQLRDVMPDDDVPLSHAPKG